MQHSLTSRTDLNGATGYMTMGPGVSYEYRTDLRYPVRLAGVGPCGEAPEAQTSVKVKPCNLLPGTCKEAVGFVWCAEQGVAVAVHVGEPQEPLANAREPQSSASLRVGKMSLF